MTPAAQALADTPILRPPTIRCRSLTVGGRQCSSRAMRGHEFCYPHLKFRHLALPRGPNITLPLFEDLDSVQVFLTQISQGLLADTIDFRLGRTLFYGCQVTSNTMPRPARLKPTKEQEAPADPVTQVFETPEGELLGPIEDTRKTAKFENSWSLHKFHYEEECERLGKLPPQTPADMPESGWLTKEDLENLDRQRAAGKIILDDGYQDKMLELHLQADRQGKLPPITERRCVYGRGPTCAGPAPHGPCYSPCKYCERERDEYLRLHPDEAPLPITGLKACAEDPSTPHVKSVNSVNPRKRRRLQNRDTQGGTPKSLRGSSCQTPTRSVPPPDPPCGCARR